MRTRGDPLFTRPALYQALHDARGGLVAEAVMDALLANPRVSRLQLRRAAMRAAFVEPLILLEPAPAGPPDGIAGSAPFALQCTVPFSGEPWLFEWEAPLWPLPHAVRGEVEDTCLLLLADAWSGEQAWLPAVLAGELQEIQRVLAAQAKLVSRYNREMTDQVRTDVERLFPRIGQADLQRLQELTFALDEDDPHDARSRYLVDQLRDQLWQHWSR